MNMSLTQSDRLRPPQLASRASQLNWSAIDLNLLIVFDALMQEHNLTRAGRRLGLSQPATSHALARLRHMLHDELFIRAPDGMQPTPRALQMAEPIREALSVLRLTLEPEDFDPAESSRSFTLLANNYAARAVVPMLARNVGNVAPNVTLDVRPVGRTEVLDQLDSGAADVALSRLVDGGDRFKCVRITDDDYVVLLDRQHPSLNEPGFCAERLARIPHVIITSSGDDTSFVDEALAQRGTVAPGRDPRAVPVAGADAGRRRPACGRAPPGGPRSGADLPAGGAGIAVPLAAHRPVDDLASAARQPSRPAMAAPHDPGGCAGLVRTTHCIPRRHVRMPVMAPEACPRRLDIAPQHGR
ncbi:MAG: LysR family transcriptional regulator [Acetobacteraceae bacterium]